MKAYPAVCDEDLCQGPAMTSRLTSHGLNGVHGRPWYAGCSSKDGREPGRVKCRHGWGPMRNRSRTDARLYIRLGEGQWVNPIGRRG